MKVGALVLHARRHPSLCPIVPIAGGDVVYKGEIVAAVGKRGHFQRDQVLSLHMGGSVLPFTGAASYEIDLRLDSV